MLKKKLISEYKHFRDEAGILDYLFWWFARALLFVALVKTLKSGNNDFLAMKIRTNFLLLFVLPLLHLLPRKIFLARISYRVQSFVSMMLIMTSYFGQYKGLYSKSEWFDLYLHFFGCMIGVYLAYELFMSLKKDSGPLDPLTGAVCGFGLSFFFAVAWEIFEFVSDCIYPMSNAQNWSCHNSQGLIKILEVFGPLNPERLALIDTMTDLIAGSLGSIVGGIILYVYLNLKTRRSDG
ncbi:MAG: hypothetical protein GX345_03300 [Clostridiales bacterium]|nr:hypothetical protein [Clostridiales bacterium]